MRVEKLEEEVYLKAQKLMKEMTNVNNMASDIDAYNSNMSRRLSAVR